MQINKDRDWEALYLANETFWDHGEASPGLVDYLGANPRVSPGQALVPGCGRGHDARALAKAGWSVAGLDIAPSSVPLAKSLADERGLSIDYHVGDFWATSRISHLTSCSSIHCSAPSRLRAVMTTRRPCTAGSSQVDFISPSTI